jgi:hypothetical protein
MIGSGYTPPAKDLGLGTNIYKDFYASFVHYAYNAYWYISRSIVIR